MRFGFIALYVVGWLVTTVLLLRGTFGDDSRGAGQRAVLGAVSVACAVALAAAWPVSGWFLPIIRAALDNRQ
ncbi:hypothetical protein LV457_13450 [Mycobacterium sp. MYCO198283]|uniref:hypothetical protein n=1 Tax=Mycobacterium sp. MYCO198283 TaxID=2883505 RepID=UPI001E3D7EDF|nr:hypothetical protein [Mycobacterium sp. MYCO198283]MCG5433283.1 hypothetical protein [Mycobacterium sp. MYCO198283]